MGDPCGSRPVEGRRVRMLRRHAKELRKSREMKAGIDGATGHVTRKGHVTVATAAAMMTRLPLRGLTQLLGLRAHALLLLPELGRELGTEVVGLEDLTNLDLGAAVEGCALEPLDRFFL